MVKMSVLENCLEIGEMRRLKTFNRVFYDRPISVQSNNIVKKTR